MVRKANFAREMENVRNMSIRKCGRNCEYSTSLGDCSLSACLYPGRQNYVEIDDKTTSFNSGNKIIICPCCGTRIILD